MGIRGLETFVKDFVPNGFVEVSIEVEIKKYASEKKLKPLLVIDLVPLIRKMFEEEKDFLFGGRWQTYSQTLDELFAKLTSAGADLVFFEDGLIEPNKYDTWITRQNKKYDEHIQVIDCINAGLSVDDIAEIHRNSLKGISTVMSLIEAMARKHGVLKFSVHKDCDAEMVRYANNHKALAILSDDSDFLIFKGDWKYWSINNLKANPLTTREFNRKGLRSTLKLTDDQLTILPTIAGNDFIRYEEVQHALGANFRHTPGLKFPNIAAFIRTSLPAGESEKSQVIASIMLGNTRTETLTRIKHSLNAYNTDFDDTEFSPLLQSCLDNDCIVTFTILNRFPKNFTLVFFDLRKTDIPSYHDMVKPLYQRQLGVLFYDEKASNPDAKFEIYSRKSHAGSFEKILVDPNYPEIEVPSLIELLDEENSDFDETRYSLLKWMTSPKLLKNAELAELPNKYFLDTLVVVFLKDIEAITCEEADIFMFSCIKVEKGETNVEYPTVIDERAFRLAFVFEKIREALYISLEIVGLKKHSTVSRFDGVVFHKSYLEYKDEGKTFENDLDDILEYRFYN